MFKVNVDTGEESLIYETGVNNSMPPNSKIYNPKINPVSDELVFTARQISIGSSDGHWGTALSKDGKHRSVLRGCELIWDKAGKSLYQVNPVKAKGGTRIVRINPITLESKTEIDLAGEFNHEYWPMESSNGNYLVFGASRSKKEHEHDTEDYEIFLWKVGSDSTKATRLTFHTGNDNWPDAYIK